MTTMTAAPAARGSRSSSLYDVLELILDKGLVIDAFVRVSLVGIELLTVDARVVVASVDTYLRFAEAANRLDLQAASDSEGLPQLVGDITSGAASSKSRGALTGAKDALSDWFGGDDDEEEREPARRRDNGGRDGDSRGQRRSSRAQRRADRDDDGDDTDDDRHRERADSRRS